MLVLSRKVGQSVELFLSGAFVGRLSVLELQSGRVRIAIDAVDELRVLRSEISDRAEGTVDGTRKDELALV